MKAEAAGPSETYLPNYSTSHLRRPWTQLFYMLDVWRAADEADIEIMHLKIILDCYLSSAVIAQSVQR
jgi:hypothetical protein